MSDICFSIMRPNVILEKPIIICESERILIQVFYFNFVVPLFNMYDPVDK